MEGVRLAVRQNRIPKLMVHLTSCVTQTFGACFPHLEMEHNITCIGKIKCANVCQDKCPAGAPCYCFCPPPSAIPHLPRHLMGVARVQELPVKENQHPVEPQSLSEGLLEP